MATAQSRSIALVLGATGYIGGAIARAAVEAGWRVRGLRRRPEAVGNVGDLPIEWFDADLNSPETLQPAFGGAEVVFHAAGYYPRRSGPVAGHVAQGVLQTRGVLDAAAAAGVRRLIYTSTLTTIGRPPPGESRSADERDLYLPGSLPTAAYYECKFAMENEVLRACAAGLPAVVLNPTAVLGPGDTTPTLGGIILAAARGWGWAWLEAEVNLVDVRDVASAHLAAAERGEIGQRYIVGGHNLPLRQAMTMLASLAGVAGPRVRIPMAVIDGLGWISDRLPWLALLGNHLRTMRDWQGYDVARARGALGLAPRPLEATLADMLDGYAARGWIKRKAIVVG
jgi:dihydroflavonol-4-reductase